MCMEDFGINISQRTEQQGNGTCPICKDYYSQLESEVLVLG